MPGIMIGAIRIARSGNQVVIFEDARSNLTAVVPLADFREAWRRIRSDPAATWRYHDRDGGTLLTAEMNLARDTHPPTLHCDVRIDEVQESPMHAVLDGLDNEKGGE